METVNVLGPDSTGTSSIVRESKLSAPRSSEEIPLPIISFSPLGAEPATKSLEGVINVERFTVLEVSADTVPLAPVASIFNFLP